MMGRLAAWAWGSSGRSRSGQHLLLSGLLPAPAPGDQLAWLPATRVACQPLPLPSQSPLRAVLGHCWGPASKALIKRCSSPWHLSPSHLCGVSSYSWASDCLFLKCCPFFIKDPKKKAPLSKRLTGSLLIVRFQALAHGPFILSFLGWSLQTWGQGRVHGCSPLTDMGTVAEFSDEWGQPVPRYCGSGWFCCLPTTLLWCV